MMLRDKLIATAYLFTAAIIVGFEIGLILR